MVGGLRGTWLPERCALVPTSCHERRAARVGLFDHPAALVAFCGGVTWLVNF
jgi:hypothetical protein